jgi:hypothetical protein
MAKKSQRAVNYRRGGLDQGQCGKCDMYRKESGGPYGTCTDVSGKISPMGVCNLIKRLSSPWGQLPHERRIAYLENKLVRLRAAPIAR